jgi:hypothetical protein
VDLNALNENSFEQKVSASSEPFATPGITTERFNGTLQGFQYIACNTMLMMCCDRRNVTTKLIANVMVVRIRCMLRVFAV